MSHQVVDRRGPWALHVPSGEEMHVFDAAQRRLRESFRSGAASIALQKVHTHTHTFGGFLLFVKGSHGSTQFPS